MMIMVMMMIMIMIMMIIIIIAVSRGTPNDILRNPGWEAPIHTFLNSALEASKWSASGFTPGARGTVRYPLDRTLGETCSTV